MISVTFSKTLNRYRHVSLQGHAGFDLHGRDIVCAAVTSVVQYVANALTEIVKMNCKVTVEENCISIAPADNASDISDTFIDALRLHLTVLSEQYPHTIVIKIKGEV